MHALIVVSHANPDSLTHAIAHRVADGITSADPAATTEFADLTAERFDQVFNSDDLAYFEKRAAAPDDVAREHARLERADTLVLVYPIYWWSFPGLLKGWIDRVLATQIDHGIFDYCGANVASSARLLASDPGFPAAHLDTAHAIGRRIANPGN
jgi:NAD(P)H dehydrogenase (quinone)